MKVVIGDTVYDPNEIPILLILEDEDKANIADMEETARNFCSYPGGTPIRDVQEWMQKAQRLVEDGE